MARALLYSGGLDSSCAWWILGKPPALYIGGAYGPARDANMGELRALEKQREISPEFAQALIIHEVDFRPFMRAGQWMLPRDRVCALAAWGAGFDSVSIAWCADDGVDDAHCARKRAEFKATVPFDFDVDFPVGKVSKTELVARALAYGAPPEFLLASHSCVRASEPCGACVNCIQRDGALSSSSGGVLIRIATNEKG